MSTPTYEPRGGTLPFKVIEFLTTNPEESLTKFDISAKFDVASNTVHSKLSLAIESGALNRAEDLATGELAYSLGTGCASIGAAPHRHPTLKAHAPFATAEPPATPQRGKRFYMDLSAVQIRDDVPLPPARKANTMDWVPLLARLQVGQSFEVPIAAKSAVGSAVVRYRKESGRGFELRRTEQTVGVWRTT